MISVDMSACGNCRQIQPGDYVLAGDTVYLYSHGYFVEVLTGEKRIPDNVRAGRGDPIPVTVDFQVTTILKPDRSNEKCIADLEKGETFTTIKRIYVKGDKWNSYSRDIVTQESVSLQNDWLATPCDVKLIVKPLTR